ncbi:OmpA family protein [Pendulispora albinea]|uniref:OmpA family protein n=1 Tax=Pendulispora albinea TaxID=2741071 RepID=A0ABZ2M2S7_9BACT
MQQEKRSNGGTSTLPALQGRRLRRPIARGGSGGPPLGPDASPEEREARERAKLNELRQILLGPDQERLAKIEEQFTPDALGKALPEAAVASQKQGEDLTWALRPTVMSAIRDAVKNDPQIFVDALVPVMGPAIRKAAMQALRSLVQQLNETLAHGFSLRGLRWRLEAARTGRPFAEIVLLRSLVYRVEQVFLVHRESGLVLHHLVAPGTPQQDPDQVAAMLSAIDAFVHDAFREEARLARFHVGELVGWVEHGPLAVLVAVVRGTAPNHFGDVLHEVQERIHLQFRQDLSSFSGEVDLFVRTESLLQRCLQSEVVPQAKSRTRFYAAAGALLTAVVCLAAWNAHRNHVEEKRFTQYVDVLRREPGLMLTSARRDGDRFSFEGLRDPLAPSPASLLMPLGAQENNTSFRFGSFYSLDPRLTEQRAMQILQPPAGVTLSVENGNTLVARGRAPRAWIASARILGPSLPAVARFDTTGLYDMDMDKELSDAAASVTKAMIVFPLGSSDITIDQRGPLEEVARATLRMLTIAPDTGKAVTLTLMGHTDPRGPEAQNQSLSAQRADRIQRELVDLGVPASVLRTRGEGIALVSESEACVGSRYRGSACARRVDFRVELQ